MRIVCLTSGGIDSSLLLFMLKKVKHDVLPLFVNYGQKSSKMERQSFDKVCKFLEIQGEIIDAEGINKIKSGLTTKEIPAEHFPFFPTRNLLLYTLGAAYAFSKSAKFVALGILKNPDFPDQTEDFVKKAEDAVNAALGIPIKFLTPFLNLDKREVLQLANKEKFPIDLTYSCYNGDPKPCKKCKACVNRQLALDANLIDNK